MLQFFAITINDDKKNMVNGFQNMSQLLIYMLFIRQNETHSVAKC